MGCTVSSYKPPVYSTGSHNTNTTSHKPEYSDKYMKQDKEMMKDLERMKSEIENMMDLLKSRGTVSTPSSGNYSGCKGGCKGPYISHK